jgi:linoleate 9S-lipoxygenase
MFRIFDKNHSQKIKGTVVLMPKNVLDFNDVTSVKNAGLLDVVGGVFDVAADVVGGIVDGATSFLGRNVAIRLISATKTDGLFSQPS